MAKFCTNCGKKLEENSSICLNCGVILNNSSTSSNTSQVKDKKKKGLPTWAIILIVVVLCVILPLIALISFTFLIFNTALDTDINYEEYIEETVTQKGEVGDTLVTKDYKITLTNASVYDSIDGEYVETPNTGMEYLVLFLDIENISNETQYINIFDFSGYVDGYTVSRENLYVTIDGMEEIGTKLLPGKKTKGYIAFEVDTSWQEFNLHYSSWNEEIEFLITNKDASVVNNNEV